MQAGQPDAEIAAVEQRLSEPEFIGAFSKILEEFDKDNTGTLDDKEYVSLVLSEKGRMCLNLLNLEPSHTEVLYRELKAYYLLIIIPTTTTTTTDTEGHQPRRRGAPRRVREGLHAYAGPHY